MQPYLDDQGQVVEANAAFCAMLGYTRDDMSHLKVTDWDVQWSGEELVAKIGDLIVHPATFETRHRRQDGTLRDVEINGVGVRLAGRNYLYAAARDITDRKQAEAALRYSQTFLDSIIEHSPNSLWVSDAHGTLIRLNQACRDILHLRDEEVVGKYNIFQDNLLEAQGLMPQVKAVFEQGLAAHFITTYDTAAVHGLDLQQTTRVALDVHISPILDVQGHITNAIIQHSDITDRLRTEEALQASEARFREVLENSLDASYKRNLQTNAYDYLSPVFARIAGYTPAEMQTLPIEVVLDLIHPADVAEVDRVIAASLADSTRTAFQVDYRFKHKTGQYRWFHDQFIVFHDAQGQPIARIGSVSDITDRKQAEDALRASDLRLEEAQAIGHMGSYVYDVHNDVWTPSSELARIFGIETGVDHSAAGWSRLVHPAHRGEALAALRNCLERQQPFDLEYRIVRPDDGQVRWLHGLGKIENDSSDAVVRIVGTNLDITNRKQAEEALRESETLLRTLVDALPERIFAKDTHSRFTLANATEIRLDGATSFDDLRGKTDFDFYPLDLAQQYYADEQLLLSTGQPLIGREERNLDQAAGMLCWQLVTKMPLRDATGRITGLVGTSVDITERKQMEEMLRDLNATLEQRVAERTTELQTANARLTKLDRLKDDFLSRISHELRTPLAGILISLELLEMSKPERRERYVQRLKDAAFRMRDMIEDVLMFSQLNLYAQPDRLEAHDLNTLIEGRVTAWRTLIAAHNLTFELNLTPDLPRARVDGELFAQALTRLVTNAANYTPTGSVTISTALVSEGEHPWVTVNVTDTGPGITPDDLPHIFERFYRGQAAADYTTPGTGIGLSISREIAEKLGGRLTVETEVGKGSTFILWLPVVSITSVA